MIFHAFQREDDDAVFTVVRNISGAAMSVGHTCAWSLTSPDGVRVSTPPSTYGPALFRGIAVEAIANSAYGKVQVHGYCAAALCSNNTSVTYTAGSIVAPVGGQVYLNYHADATYVANVGGGFVVLAEAVAAAAATQVNKAVFIRAL